MNLRGTAIIELFRSVERGSAEAVNTEKVHASESIANELCQYYRTILGNLFGGFIQGF
jgi:hypothetical protein